MNGSSGSAALGCLGQSGRRAHHRDFVPGRTDVPIEVTMPKLSPTMETGVIVQWLVKVGDSVKEGDILAEIETDKATMPMKSYDEGTIVHIDHAAGEEVALGQRVMVLARKGEDPQQVVAGLGVSPAPGGATAEAAAAKPPPAAPAPAPAGSESLPPRAVAESASSRPAPAADQRQDRTTGNGQQSVAGGD